MFSYKEVKDDQYQKFYYQPESYGSYSTEKIMEMMKLKTITKREVDVMRYLYRLDFAPISYIVRDLFPEYGDKEVLELRERLILLAKKRVFNMFTLVNEYPQDVRFDMDREIFFTLDFGAIAILRSLIPDEDIDNWKAKGLVMTSNKVRKKLMMSEFYHRVKDECGEEAIDSLVLDKPFSFGGNRFSSRAVLKLRGKYFLLEAVCDFDLYDGSETYILNKLRNYEEMFERNSVISYYFDEAEAVPVLIIVCDERHCADRIAHQMEGWSIPNVRYICLDEEKPLREAFYRYDNGELIPVIAETFAKK